MLPLSRSSSRLPPSDLDKRILALLVREIEQQKTTRVELAARLGCTTSAVGQVLSGKHAISLRTVERYLHALGKKLEIKLDDIQPHVEEEIKC